ncbi:MAG: metal-dependent hydrolase [Candidatus Nezhaarchaeales archaeon]
MDVLTHVFLPLTIIYALKKEFKAWYFPLALSTIIPDLDVLTGIHRGLLHSLLFLLPLICIAFTLEYAFRRRLELSTLFSIFILSHLALDALAGGAPFLYPLVNLSVGVEFPFIIRFGQSISIVDVMPKIVYGVPHEVCGEMNVFSGFGVASAIAFTITWLKTWREKVRF